MEKYSYGELQLKANKIRVSSLEMIDEAGGGHIGGSMSAMDLMTALYFRVMNIEPSNPQDPERDRFILSAGHKAAGYFPVLAERGFISGDSLKTFNKMDSPYGMHPDKNKITGCEASTGSLGHGLPMAMGMALALRMDKIQSRIYVLMGDGELHEGTVWEAAMSCAQHRLGNIIALVDYNKCCMDGPIDNVVSLEPLIDKWAAFGWEVKEIDGHNMNEIVDSLESRTTDTGKPGVFIAHTIKGKGVPVAEGDYHWHYGLLNEEQMTETRQILGV